MNTRRLIVFVILAFLPGVVGGIFGPGEWYQDLAKPAWTPPGWIFGPVWTLLYLLIGVSGAMAYGRCIGTRRVGAFTVYGLQLLLNAAWSWIFFGLHRPGAAFAEIAVLLVLILANILLFLRCSRTAGLLLVPYALWVAFASALNYSIWQLNS